jgi:hypothetical protein
VSTKASTLSAVAAATDTLEEVDGPVMGLLEYMSSTLSSVMNPIWRSHDHEATIRKNQYTSVNPSASVVFAL